MLPFLRNGEIILKDGREIRVLKNMKLFRDFSEENLNILLVPGQCRVSHYRKNTVLYIQGQKCETFDVILDGRILVQRIDESGNVMTVSEFDAGETLGGNLVFSDSNVYPMTVISRTDSEILHISKGLILKFCQTDQNFLYEFIRSISNRTIILTSRFKSVTMKTIRQLIVDFLIQESEIQGTNKVKLYMTKKEWAQKLGVQRPSLSRELIRMKEEGLIDFDRESIEIKRNLTR